MAKKKKKLTKYNQLIRTYFDGDGFDDGITRVGKEQLIELAYTIGLKHVELTPEHLVRAFRRIWSEADVEARQQIVNYFKELGQVFTGSGEKQQTSDKSEKIETFLDQLTLSDDEAKALKREFMAERTKRISLPKIEKALLRLRFEKKLQHLESLMDITFDDGCSI